MPVVQLYLDRLQKLVGKKTSKNKIISKIPYLGLDIEEQTKEYLRVEYSPNRPDYATDFGIAAGLQGLLDIKKGLGKFSLKKGNYSIKVESSVRKIRPYISAAVAKNGSLDDETIRQLITIQEDLHFGIGRKRKKASIGIHDLDKITFPVKYTTKNKNHKFVPLDSTKESSLEDILEKTDVGKEYGYILSSKSKLPVILDSKDITLSFPPIINSAATTITTKTKNLLIEVTALDKNAAEDLLAIICATLQNSDFSLYSVKISGAHNSTPSLKPKKITLNTELVNNVLGLKLSPAKIVAALRKCRLDADAKRNKIICTVPRFRFDILGQMDVVEEVALGYGIENLKPTLPASSTVGEKNKVTKLLDTLSIVMVGLGFTEALNPSLVSTKLQTKFSQHPQIEVVESKSLEHAVLRDSILPSLLENLAKNVHEQYPHKLFEIGTVFSKENPIKENTNLACICAHKNTNYSEIKSILQSSLKSAFNIKCETKTSNQTPFSKGRTAKIVVDKKTVGVVGEIDFQLIEDYKIRVPVSAFEIQLSGLIFD